MTPPVISDFLQAEKATQAQLLIQVLQEVAQADSPVCAHQAQHWLSHVDHAMPETLSASWPSELTGFASGLSPTLRNAEWVLTQAFHAYRLQPHIQRMLKAPWMMARPLYWPLLTTDDRFFGPAAQWAQAVLDQQELSANLLADVQAQITPLHATLIERMQDGLWVSAVAAPAETPNPELPPVYQQLACCHEQPVGMADIVLAAWLGALSGKIQPNDALLLKSIETSLLHQRLLSEVSS